MSWSRRTTTGMFIIAALAASSCSDGTASAPIAPPVTPAPPATDVVATLVTNPPATAAPTTPATTAAPAPTTAAATSTTLDPAAALEALRLEIEADLNEGEQAFLQGAMDPGSEASRALIEEYYSGPALSRTLALYEQFDTDGLLLRPNTSVSNLIVLLEIVESRGIEALVRLCRVDGNIKYQPLGDTEIIVDDRVARFLTTTQVALTEETWRVVDGTTEDLAIGTTTCDE